MFNLHLKYATLRFWNLDLKHTLTDCGTTRRTEKEPKPNVYTYLISFSG